jgi:hypothetical protein
VSNHSNSIVGCASLDIHQTKSTQGFKVENIVLKQSGRAKVPGPPLFWQRYGALDGSDQRQRKYFYQGGDR